MEKLDNENDNDSSDNESVVRRDNLQLVLMMKSNCACKILNSYQVVFCNAISPHTKLCDNAGM